MDEHILSPEEIKELTKTGGDELNITQEEIDALGEIGNISMGTSATTLYSLLRNKVVITTPRVCVTTIKELKDTYPIPFISVEVSYTEGLHGSNLMVIKEEDAKIIADLMMGGDGTNIDAELDDIRMSAVGEAMNQMMGSAATSLSTMLKKEINISPPRLNKINLATDSLEAHFGEDEEIVKVSFRMEVGDILKSEIMQLLPVDFAKSLVQDLYSLSLPEETPSKSQEVKQETIVQQPIHEETQPKVAMGHAQETMSSSVSTSSSEPQVTVSPVQFPTFDSEPVSSQSYSLDLIMDVPLEITVELGRTVKTIKEILDFAPGTILELDKIAGEPVDILVNGKFIAKGEVVVIDENFGVRITEIINSVDRVKSLQ